MRESEVELCGRRGSPAREGEMVRAREGEMVRVRRENGGDASEGKMGNSKNFVACQNLTVKT